MISARSNVYAQLYDLYDVYVYGFTIEITDAGIKFVWSSEDKNVEDVLMQEFLELSGRNSASEFTFESLGFESKEAKKASRVLIEYDDYEGCMVTLDGASDKFTVRSK